MQRGPFFVAFLGRHHSRNVSEGKYFPLAEALGHDSQLREQWCDDSPQVRVG